jgi:hypothetical protein
MTGQEQPVEETPEQQSVVHERVECDGCSVAPITGVRYKCAVCQDFDYCAKCEESLEHPHPMLKIRKAGGAPAMMVTVLNEAGSDKPAKDQKPDWHALKQQWRQMMGSGEGKGKHCPLNEEQRKEWREKKHQMWGNCTEEQRKEWQEKKQAWKQQMWGSLDDKTKDELKSMKQEWKDSCKQGLTEEQRAQWKQNRQDCK